MLPYILVCVTIIALGTFFYRKDKPNLITPFLCVILVLFSGLRGEFTADHAAYSRFFLYGDTMYSFLEILRSGGMFGMEKAFVVFSRFIGCFTDSVVVYTVVISAITVGLFFRFFSTYSKIPWITILLYFSLGNYFASFNLVRQLLAVAIILNAIPFLCQKRWIAYAFVVAIAAMIHSTALVMLPIGLLLTTRVTKMKVLMLMIATAVTYFWLPSIVEFIQATIIRYSNTTFGLGQGSFNAVIPTLGIALFVIYSVYIGDCEFDCSEIENRIMINGLLLHLATLILAVRVYNVARFAEYFEPFVLVLTANVIAKYRNYRERVIIIAAICFLAVAFTYITLSGTGYVPYYTIFQEGN